MLTGSTHQSVGIYSHIWQFAIGRYRSLARETDSARARVVSQEVKHELHSTCGKWWGRPPPAKAARSEHLHRMGGTPLSALPRLRCPGSGGGGDAALQVDGYASKVGNAARPELLHEGKQDSVVLCRHPKPNLMPGDEGSVFRFDWVGSEE